MALQRSALDRNRDLSAAGEGLGSGLGSGYRVHPGSARRATTRKSRRSRKAATMAATGSPPARPSASAVSAACCAMLLAPAQHMSGPSTEEGKGVPESALNANSHELDSERCEHIVCAVCFQRHDHTIKTCLAPFCAPQLRTDPELGPGPAPHVADNGDVSACQLAGAKQGRRTRGALALDASGGFGEALRRGEVPQPPAGHRERLAEAVHRQRPRPHAWAQTGTAASGRQLWKI